MIIDENGDSVTNIDEVTELLPQEFALYQNYPNPFNPITKIKFVIPNEERNLKDFSLLDKSGTRNDNAKVTLKVFDILGREVATLINEEKSPGEYEVEFNASQFSSGVYFFKLQAGGFIQTKKMICAK